MLNKFWLDGVCSLDVGIRLQNAISFGQPVPRVTVTTVAGRNGDLAEWDGSYSNISASAQCFLLSSDKVSDVFPAIAAFLRGGTLGYRRLETEEEPDVYRMARVTNFPETEIRANRLAPFSLSWDCKPQKYLKVGETSFEVKSGETLYNPTQFAALPLLELTLTGDAKLQIGDVPMSIAGYTGKMLIDCELQDAYRDGANLNRYLTASEFPQLARETRVSWTGGISSLLVTPRWWTI